MAPDHPSLVWGCRHTVILHIFRFFLLVVSHNCMKTSGCKHQWYGLCPPGPTALEHLAMRSILPDSQHTQPPNQFFFVAGFGWIVNDDLKKKLHEARPLAGKSTISPNDMELWITRCLVQSDAGTWPMPRLQSQIFSTNRIPQIG